MSLRRCNIFVEFFGAERFSLVTLNHMASKEALQMNTNSSMMMGFLGALFVVLAILLLFGTCTESGKQQFENFKNKFTRPKKDIKPLDIVMFMSPTCPFCKKMEDLLKKEGHMGNITVVDITKKEGLEFAKQFGADKQPVPSFISRTLKTATVGSKESIDGLIADLSVKHEPSTSEPSSSEPSGGIDMGLVDQLQIVLFARESCPWCTKAKSHCDQMGVTNRIKIVDINSPEGQSLSQSILPPGTSAVPAWVSVATKKSVVGFQPLVDILQKLK
jgi:glutaredoxin